MNRKLSRPGVREGYDLWSESYDQTPNPLIVLELAIAGVSVSVVRTESYGVVDPGGFALVIEYADRAELRPNLEGKDGYIFFTSHRKEKEIQQMQVETEKLANKSALNAK